MAFTAMRTGVEREWTAAVVLRWARWRYRLGYVGFGPGALAVDAVAVYPARMRALVVVLVGFLVASCGSAAEVASGAASEVTVATPAPHVACSDTSHEAEGDSAGIMRAPGAYAGAAKGTVLKCTKRPMVTAEDLDESTYSYSGAIHTDADVYRITYRTERGDEASTPGYASAIVMVPKYRRAEKLPVIVSSHGTHGEGPRCTTSQSPTVDGYIHAPLLGAGYIVIAPDLAGYVNYGAPGNPASGYANVADIGKSTLDAARALRNMFPSSFNDKVVIVGHSLGGGTALAALASNESYGAGGTLAGVVSYAPPWGSNARWAAVDFYGHAFPLQREPLKNAAAIWFMYTNAELYDGQGHGVDVFRADKRAMVKDFVENDCYPDFSFGPEWGTSIADVYDPRLIASLSHAAETGGPCPDALCETWKKRILDARPHLTGSAREVPLLLAYGGRDTTIRADRMACTIERLEADRANYTLCYDPGAGHTEIVGRQADFVNAWIAARTLGAPEPRPTCAQELADQACATVPPNEWAD